MHPFFPHPPVSRAFRAVTVAAALLGSAALASADTVNYNIQTSNFNAQQMRVPSGGAAGAFNTTDPSGAPEVGLYANGGSGGTNETAFQTFSTTGTTSGSARALQVGDNFAITVYSGGNPYGFAGVYFNGNTTYSSYSNYNTNERTALVLGPSGNYFIENNGSNVDTGIGAGTSVTLKIAVTSSNSFNLTITNNTNGTSTTYSDLFMKNAGSITSFALALQNDSNNNFYVKNGVLTDTGSVAVGASGLSTNYAGSITDGLAASSTSTVRVNNLAKSGNGTVTLTGVNTFSGMTTVSAGTLALNADGSLGGGQTSHTSLLTVSTGGTLLLGGSGATDRINDATPVVLSGGAINTAGLSERVGALTLTGTSTVDLGAGTSTLIFGGTSTRTAGTLAFSNWTDGSDHVFFYTDATGTTAYAVPSDFLSNITINGFGVTELSTGEIVPVPEPATWLAGFLTLGLAGYRLRRRWQRAA